MLPFATSTFYSICPHHCTITQVAAEFVAAGGMPALLDAVEAAHGAAHASARAAAARAALLLAQSVEARGAFEAEAARRPGLPRALKVLT